MRKLILLLCMVAMVVPVYAQDATPEMTTEALTPWTCPDGFQGQTLNVYNWSTYIAENTVPDFEAACGVTVVYDVYDSNESLIARLSGGNPGYDIVVPTDHAVADMVNRGMLQPIDLNNIPNFANVIEAFKNPPYDPGNQYSVPYQWGTVGIGYYTDKVGETVDSWEQLFNYDGRVAWLEDKRTMIGIALTILGYDANSTDPNQINEARDFLINNSGNVTAIAQDDGQVMLERGDVDMTIEYSGDIFALIDGCECDNIAYAIPKEGTNLWVDNLAIPTDAPNKALAEVFIDYILDPQVGADISNYTAYATPNQASLDDNLIDPELLNNPAIYPSEETRSHLFQIEPLPDAEQLYNDAWDEIKVSMGR